VNDHGCNILIQQAFPDYGVSGTVDNATGTRSLIPAECCPCGSSLTISGGHGPRVRKGGVVMEDPGGIPEEFRSVEMPG
jgi:hypothetical protein